jgi:hypothetical protein
VHFWYILKFAYHLFLLSWSSGGVVSIFILGACSRFHLPCHCFRCPLAVVLCDTTRFICMWWSSLGTTRYCFLLERWQIPLDRAIEEEFVASMDAPACYLPSFPRSSRLPPSLYSFYSLADRHLSRYPVGSSSLAEVKRQQRRPHDEVEDGTPATKAQ